MRVGLSRGHYNSNQSFFVFPQYIEPAVSNSLVPFDQMDLSLIVERILKISLPMLYVWLTGSYLLFHLLLNISAEVLR